MINVVKGSRAPDLAALRAERDVLAAEKSRLEDVVRTHEALVTAAAQDLKNSLAAITMRADLLQAELQEVLEAPDEAGTASLKAGMVKIHTTASSQ